MKPIYIPLAGKKIFLCNYFVSQQAIFVSSLYKRLSLTSVQKRFHTKFILKYKRKHLLFLLLQFIIHEKKFKGKKEIIADKTLPAVALKVRKRKWQKVQNFKLSCKIFDLGSSFSTNPSYCDKVKHNRIEILTH